MLCLGPKSEMDEYAGTRNAESLRILRFKTELELFSDGAHGRTKFKPRSRRCSRTRSSNDGHDMPASGPVWASIPRTMRPRCFPGKTPARRRGPGGRVTQPIHRRSTRCPVEALSLILQVQPGKTGASRCRDERTTAKYTDSYESYEGCCSLSACCVQSRRVDRRRSPGATGGPAS